MNYSINQAGGAVSTYEELQTKIAVREAKKKGHKFITLYYNQDLIQDAVMQGEVRINGIKTIQIYESRDNKNRLTYDVTVRGGQLIFLYDEASGEWIAEMLDDETPGLYGKPGYNRDFLATHHETGEFTIKSRTVLNDVKKRLEHIKTVKHSEEIKAIEEDSSVLPTLEEEMARLQEKIAKAKELKEKAQSSKVPSIKKEPDAEHTTSS